MYDFKRIFNQEPAALVGVVEAVLAVALYFVSVAPELIVLVISALTLILNIAYVRPKTVSKDALSELAGN